MNQTIEGIYKNGTVVLDRLPSGVSEGRVVVQFVAQLTNEISAGKRGCSFYGMFAPVDGQFTTDEELERVKKSWNAKIDALEL